MNEKEQLLYNIGVVDFTLTELSLYLDTHSGDRKAMEYFEHYSQIKKQLCREFSGRYFPLTLNETNPEKQWSWGAAPLPWEGECG
ncbi:MAG: spore coat protein CotJB [Lachnospiraceae bacterium]|nr:spore coat protein CotJB [Lachnospiraceae bacterium]